MIVTRTPHRLSICGGGTDIPPLCHEYGGLVVGGAITQYAYITVRRLPPFHEYKSRIIYTNIELVKDHGDIQHGAVKACLEHVGQNDGVEIFHQADIPARSGTGSSSTFVVGLLNALHSLRGNFLGPEALATEAIRIEQDILRENVGFQDQVWAASHTGGPAAIHFHPDRTRTVIPLGLSEDHVRDLEKHLLLFYTNLPRTSSDVAATYYEKLKDSVDRHFAMVRLAEECVTCIRKADYEGLGVRVDRAWRLKASLSPQVCPPRVSDLYMRGRLAGAWGGKLMGAGGGGCIFLVAPVGSSAAIIEEMRGLGCVHIPFRFARMGSHVMVAEHS